MEDMQQITIDEWMSWKEDIRKKLAETARNFVYIGYRLKQIRDSGMYDGAEDIFEFALKEYGLSKSTVSRFIAINEKFSENGNSLELKEEYRAIGSSKLAEMLTLTDAECRLITEKTTVSQIREFKSFSRQASGAVEDEGSQERKWTPLQKCIIEYFRGKKEMLDAAMKCIFENDHKQASEIISPNGNTTVKKGIIFLFMYDYKEGVKYRTFGSDETTVMSWDDFIMDIFEIFQPDYDTRRGYEAFYNEPEKVEEMPEILNGKGSVATSQQNEKEEERNVEKMVDDEASEGGTKEGAETPENADAVKPEDDEDGAGGEIENQDVLDMAAGLDGNDEEKFEDEIERFDDKKGSSDNENAGSGTEEQIKYYKAEIKAYLEIMDYRYEKEDWAGVIKKAEDIIWSAEQIQKIQKEEERE
ncbi:MAG: hypothetical protein HDQ96_04680 [Lachnospiraceae bacterium]|nr:hypothetical protein [Lachnospiraceae bacterium]